MMTSQYGNSHINKAAANQPACLPATYPSIHPLKQPATFMAITKTTSIAFWTFHPTGTRHTYLSVLQIFVSILWVLWSIFRKQKPPFKIVYPRTRESANERTSHLSICVVSRLSANTRLRKPPIKEQSPTTSQPQQQCLQPHRFDCMERLTGQASGPKDFVWWRIANWKRSSKQVVGCSLSVRSNCLAGVVPKHFVGLPNMFPQVCCWQMTFSLSPFLSSR